MSINSPGIGQARMHAGASNGPVVIVAGRSLARPEALALARALQADGGHDIVVLDENLARARVTPDADGYKAIASTQSALTAGLKRSALARSMVLALRAARLGRLARQILRRLKPSAVVVFDDRHVLPDRVVIAAARELAVPSVLVPYAVSSLESDIFVRADVGAYTVDVAPWQAMKNRVADRLPDQVATTADGRRLLFYPLPDTLALERLGLLPAKPWVYGGSGTDVVCASGPDHADYMKAGGVAEQRIADTGQPSLDALCLAPADRRALRLELTRRHRLDPMLPLVICAVPQHGEHGMADWTRHLQLTADLFDVLARCGATVLLSLHPKAAPATYRRLANERGLPIATERMIEILPGADLLVAAFSSTIRWAAGLGIPAIAVDNLDSGYQLYDNFEGVFTARSMPELFAALRDFSRSDPVRQERRAAADRDRQRIGGIDGRNAERTCRAILRLHSVGAEPIVLPTGRAH